MISQTPYKEVHSEGVKYFAALTPPHRNLVLNKPLMQTSKETAKKVETTINATQSKLVIVIVLIVYPDSIFN